VNNKNKNPSDKQLSVFGKEVDDSTLLTISNKINENIDYQEHPIKNEKRFIPEEYNLNEIFRDFYSIEYLIHSNFTALITKLNNDQYEIEIKRFRYYLYWYEYVEEYSGTHEDFLKNSLLGNFKTIKEVMKKICENERTLFSEKNKVKTSLKCGDITRWV